MPASDPPRRVVPLRDAFRALGVGPTAGYRLARTGQFPVPVIRIGRRLVVPLAPLERLLAGDETQTGPTDRVA